MLFYELVTQVKYSPYFKKTIGESWNRNSAYQKAGSSSSKADSGTGSKPIRPHKGGQLETWSSRGPC